MTTTLTIAGPLDRSGLSSAEADARLRRDGPNTVHVAAGRSALTLLLRQFRSPLVLILVIAAAVSGLVQQWLEGGIILAIVLGGTLLGFVQEYRASNAVAALQRQWAPWQPIRSREPVQGRSRR